MIVSFKLNHQSVTVDSHPGETLLEYLREAGTFSVKYGCDDGLCGACTVLIDGAARNACLVLMHTLEGRHVETLEGLQDCAELVRLQDAFIDEGAIQCGYCTPGMLLSAVALFRQEPEPDEGRIRKALAGNLCRCTGYVKPVAALQQIAGKK